MPSNNDRLATKANITFYIVSFNCQHKNNNIILLLAHPIYNFL